MNHVLSLQAQLWSFWIPRGALKVATCKCLGIGEPKCLYNPGSFVLLGDSG